MAPEPATFTDDDHETRSKAQKKPSPKSRMNVLKNTQRNVHSIISKKTSSMWNIFTFLWFTSYHVQPLLIKTTRPLSGQSFSHCLANIQAVFLNVSDCQNPVPSWAITAKPSPLTWTQSLNCEEQHSRCFSNSIHPSTHSFISLTAAQWNQPPWTNYCWIGNSCWLRWCCWLPSGKHLEKKEVC